MSAPFGPLLESLTRLRGVRGAMLVAADDGLVVAESLMGGVEGAPVAALAASLAGRAAELNAQAGVGAPRFLHLQAADGSLLVAPATADLVLVTVVGRDAPLGLARLEMLRVAERLA